jgi:hypothetical protein
MAEYPFVVSLALVEHYGLEVPVDISSDWKKQGKDIPGDSHGIWRGYTLKTLDV